jgi:hypothetical protein
LFANEDQNERNYRVIAIAEYAIFNLILWLMVGWLYQGLNWFISFDANPPYNFFRRQPGYPDPFPGGGTKWGGFW